MLSRYQILLIAFLFSSFCASAGTNYTSNGTGGGNWTSNSSWSPSTGFPAAGDNVTILAGDNVTMNGNTGACNSLTISGTATWAAALTTNVGAGGITVNSGGDIAGAFNGILTTTGGLTLNATLSSALVLFKLQPDKQFPERVHLLN